MAANDASAVLYRKRGPIAWVTLNRPAQFNAYNMAMRDALFGALSAIHEDSEIRAMVLCGAGRAFSTGGDLAEFGMAPSPIVARWVRFRRDVWGMMRALPIPTIAAIHGYTVGGGLEMALLCDLAIAADDTRICLPETGAGMIPGVAGTQTASRRLGLGRALDLCITGRWIDAREALLVGLVGEIVPVAELDGRALAIARSISKVPREQSALVKMAMWNGLDVPRQTGLELEQRLWKRMALMRTGAQRRNRGNRSRIRLEAQD
ncbi:MAG: enoyl-CoA hydratase/carnithine racemase [Candidatus Binatus sp.]|nr:enoyl-CoA hydratase/carnithine racemase [Candidatus Binatus sp.]